MNCHNGGINTEVENRLQQQEGLRENSTFQGARAVRISVVSAIKVKSKKKVGDGNALPAAKESSGIENPAPGLETEEAPLSLGIRQAT